MAGSLNSIVADNGTFTMEMIEDLGDAYEALEECFHIIAYLVRKDPSKLDKALRKLNYVSFQRPLVSNRRENVRKIIEGEL